jgi:transposase-like protein
MIDGDLRGWIMISFRGAHFEKKIILTCVRWHVVYPLSYRQTKEMMQARGLGRPHHYQPLQ